VNRKLLLLGGGGHCKSIIDTLLQLHTYSAIGIVEKQDVEKASILTVPIVGRDRDVLTLFEQGYTYAFVSLGSIGNIVVRRNLFDLVENIGFMIPNILDPGAQVSPHIQLGRGIFIGKHAVLNIGTAVEDCAIINSSAVIDHDCHVGSFSHIAPGTVLCGDVHVGNNTHVGAHSVIRQQVSIGNDVIIGMGSVVLHDIPDGVIAYGNPCKVIKNRELFNHC